MAKTNTLVYNIKKSINKSIIHLLVLHGFKGYIQNTCICPELTGKPWNVMSPDAVIYLIDSQAMTSWKYLVFLTKISRTKIYIFDYFNTVIFSVIVKNVSEVDLQPPYLLIYNICKV